MFRLMILIPSMLLPIVLIPYLYMKRPPPLPKIDLEEWWGRENETVTDDIRLFQVQFDNSKITDLKNRLRNARFVTPLEGVAFEYGFNGNTLKKWLKYWDEEYPFSERETLLNTYPQFKTNIQGLDIHFIRVKPEVPRDVEVVPMLILHGWPGSVREFYEAIPYLTAVSSNRNYAIEVVIPSLPGFGFSSAAIRRGLGADKVAVVLRNLMHRLGYKKYYIQGGDMGGVITKNMATFFPEEILGYHTNFPALITPTITFYKLQSFILTSLGCSSATQNSTQIPSNSYSVLVEETGYLHLQATRPDTIGVALADSPGGLAAYILEKFSTGSRLAHRQSHDGGLTNQFTKNNLLDNIMLYFITNTMTTAARLYAETFNMRYYKLQLDQIPSPVPTIATQALHDISYTETWALKIKFPNLLRNTLVEDLGHFQAFEQPELFANDVIKAVGDFREWHKYNNS